MECKQCGEKLKNGLLFCPHCGAEIRYVPDYNILEEDILDSYIGNEQARKRPVRPKRQENPADRHLARQRWFVPVLVLSIVAVLGIAVGVSGFSNTPPEEEEEIVYTYDYYLQQGRVYSNEGNYAQALTLIQTAMKLNPNGYEAVADEAECLLALGQRNDAEKDYIKLLDMTDDNTDYVAALITLYEEDGKFKKILALADKTKDPDLLTRIKSFQVLPPSLSMEGGSYSETLHISLDSEGDAEILYTLDETDPREEGIPYEEEITISEEGTHVLTAVCKSENGLYSEPVSATYEISFPVPGEPVPSIPSGEYLIEQTVSFSVPSGCTAYYTWDGGDPNSSSSQYTGPIYLLPGSHSLAVVYISSHGKTGPVARFTYTLYTEEVMVG